MEPEDHIREAFDDGDMDEALTRLLEAYSIEVVRYLAGRLEDADDAAEVFAIATERAWRSLPTFEWRSSARGWLYAIARNAANSYTSAPHRRVRRNVALSRITRVSQLVVAARDETARYRQTTNKDRLRALREQLPEADQTLLVLRIDRNLAWRDLAVVLGEGDDPERAAARLRQRFKAVKTRLRGLAEEAGLL